MTRVAQNILSQRVEKGTIALYWLGQAGFLIKDDEGRLTAIDPYFSDCCERYHGFKRVMAHFLEVDELQLDNLLLTHSHYDHFDVDSVPRLLANGHTHMVGAMDTKAECNRLGIREETCTFIKVGDKVETNGMTVEAVPCDHGALAPDAVGLLMTVSGKKVYLAGDTAFRPEYFQSEKLQGVDLAILPINGAFGNLNEEQAADAAKLLGCKTVVPCHFWCFAEHGGNPMLFVNAMKDKAPEIRCELMKVGTHITI